MSDHEYSFDQHARERLSAVMARRSSQYRWFWDNWDWFNQELQKSGKPDWGAIAAEMGRLNLTNAKGEAPTAAGTRQAFNRIKNLKWAEVERTKNENRPTIAPNLPAADMTGGFSLRSQKPKG